MSATVINATEAGRNFSELLNRVKYQGASFTITRGKEVVASLVPVSPAAGLKLAELGKFFADLPRLDDTELDAFEQDLRAIRSSAGPEGNVWD